MSKSARAVAAWLRMSDVEAAEHRRLAMRALRDAVRAGPVGPGGEDWERPASAFASYFWMRNVDKAMTPEEAILWG
jgi:hypothetical protein